MVFVELTPFVSFREQNWTDDEFRALQRFLLLSPAAGDVIRGTHGHAWCRVWDQDAGLWLDFDPTPPDWTASIATARPASR